MQALAERADALTWYHSIDLPGGVTTKGLFDARRMVAALPIPESLAGKRCLDIGTCDGFWAFELERRGADEVVAVDLADTSRRDGTVAALDVPADLGRAKATFALAHEALGSKVIWKDCSVYDLDPADIGTFDFVYMGTLLLHLRDPIRAIAAVRGVTGGEFLSNDQISPLLSLVARRTPAAVLHGAHRNEWWVPNRAGRLRELIAGGFEIIDHGSVSWLERRDLPLKWRDLRKRPLGATLLAWKGVPHTWVRARPGPHAPAIH